MNFTKKRVILGTIIIIILSAVIFTSIQNSTGNYQNGKQKFKEFTIERGIFKILVTTNGGVIPIDRVEIKSKASGLVEELPVEQGDFIKKGDLIALRIPDGGKADKNKRVVMLKKGNSYEPRRIEIGLDNFKEVEILSGLNDGDIVGVFMTSRLKEENDRRETRIRSSRSFGTTN